MVHENMHRQDPGRFPPLGFTLSGGQTTRYEIWRHLSLYEAMTEAGLKDVDTYFACQQKMVA